MTPEQLEAIASIEGTPEQNKAISALLIRLHDDNLALRAADRLVRSIDQSNATESVREAIDAYLAWRKS